MAITLVAVSGWAYRNNGGPFTLSLPFGDVLTDDLLVAFLETDNSNTTSMPGWAVAPGAPVIEPDGEGSRLSIYWKRALGGETSAGATTSGDHGQGRIAIFRGVKKVGDPWGAWSSSHHNNPSGSSNKGFSIPSITTPVDNCAIFMAISAADSEGSFNGWTNPNLTGLLERSDDNHDLGNGGSLACAVGHMLTAGATGATTGFVSEDDEEWAAWIGALLPEPGVIVPPDVPEDHLYFRAFDGRVTPISNLLVELIREDRELPYGTIAFDTWQWDTPEPLLEDRDRIDYYLAWQMMDNTMESQPKKIDAIRLTAKGNNPTIQIYAASPGDEISKEDLEDGENARASVRFEDSEEVTRYERKKVKIKNLSIWTARYSGSWDGENERDRLDELIIEGDIHGTTK